MKILLYILEIGDISWISDLFFHGCFPAQESFFLLFLRSQKESRPTYCSQTNLVNIDKCWHTFWRMTICRKIMLVSFSQMISEGVTVVRALSSPKGAETSATCHVNNNHRAHACGTQVQC